MRALRVSAAVAFVVLILVLPNGEVSGATAYNLPPESSLFTYIQTFVSEFNNLVRGNYPGYSDSALRAMFPVYQNQGSFEVVIMQTAPDTPGYVTLIFNRITGNNLFLAMDNMSTFQDLNGNVFGFGEVSFVFTNVEVTFSNGVSNYYAFAMGLPSANITGDTVSNAYSQAGTVFRYQVANPTTVSETTNMPAPSQSPPSNVTTEFVFVPAPQGFVWSLIDTMVLIVFTIGGGLFSYYVGFVYLREVRREHSKEQQQLDATFRLNVKRQNQKKRKKNPESEEEKT